MEEQKPVLENIEEAAGEKLGVGYWDRPAIFRDSAAAATDGDLPYWLVLLLSGAIATLGLALNSSAVVIGAMLVAPLLSPVVGLALALAMGDGRLAVQTGWMVVLSTIGVVLIGALLTLLLPFQTVTAEISARTRPTTLDLAIAVFSGLVGAVVTVGRGKRLSAAIPGVAISVALIPPLAVAGFGMGSGWNGELIRGSLLLYGANLAGIVLSGMLVFLLVGMHREPVLETAREWHRSGGESPTGVVAWLDRRPAMRRLGVIRSMWARVGLVFGFVVAVSLPLSKSLNQIVRETRVQRAVEAAAAAFEVPDRSFVLSQQVVRGANRTQVYLRVATTQSFGDEAREAFERLASARAGEPVRLVLQQLPASDGDLAQIAALLPERETLPAVASALPPPVSLSGLLDETRERLQQAARELSLPDGAAVAGIEMAIDGAGAPLLRVGIAAPEPLPPAAEQILRRQLVRALDTPRLTIEFVPVSTAPRLLGTAAPDTTALRETGVLLRRYPALRAELIAGAEADSADVAAALALLAGPGVDRARIATRRDGSTGLRLRLRPTFGGGE